MTQQASVQYDINGITAPTEFLAVFSDPYGGFTTEWSPCGEAALNMNRQVRLVNSNRATASGIFELIGGNWVVPWSDLEWRKCA